MNGGDAIAVRDLAKEYRSGAFRRRRTRALAGVSLSVRRGEIFGLLGPNGAGKTTLVKILLGIAWKTVGEAELLGEPVPSAAARRRVGFLPENHRLPGYLSGAQAIDFFGALSGAGRRERRARGAELLARLGLAEAAGRKLRSYSKGMLQRLGLALALVHDPEVVILDEPTDGVDPVGRREIRDMLVELRRAGKSVLVSSHILTEIELICDRIALIDRGHLIYEGSVGALTERRGEWDIAVARPAPDLEAALRARAREVRPREGGGWTVVVEREEEIDAIVDAIRERRAGLRALAPRRSTLEERVIAMLRTPQGSTPEERAIEMLRPPRGGGDPAP